MSTPPAGSRRPVRLTAEDVRTTKFGQSQLGWRGYSEDEVDAFLTKVADAMIAADKQRAGLCAEIERLRNFYREHGEDVDLAGRRRSRRVRERTADDDLVCRVREFIEVQVDRACDYADLLDRRVEEAADDLFHHALVHTAYVIEQSIRTCSGRADARAWAEPAMLERALVWLRTFTYALHAQLNVSDDALVQATSGPAAPGLPRRS